jgi:hypothetical protein
VEGSIQDWCRAVWVSGFRLFYELH